LPAIEACPEFRVIRVFRGPFLDFQSLPLPANP
jgi:hypothetical protein